MRTAPIARRNAAYPNRWSSTGRATARPARHQRPEQGSGGCPRTGAMSSERTVWPPSTVGSIAAPVANNP